MNNNLMSICLNGISDSTQQVVFTWIGQGPDYPVVCKKRIKLHCDRDYKCVAVVKDSIYCDGDSVRYSFYIKNFAAHSIQSLVIRFDSVSNVIATPKFNYFPNLLPGQVYGPINVTLSGSGLIPGQLICFTLMTHDSTTCKNSKFCCSDGIKHCLVVPPLCNPCKSLTVTPVGDGLDCCWELKLSNQAFINVVGVQTQVISGGGFTSINNPLGSGWNTNVVNNQNVYWTASNNLPLPISSLLPKFCLDGTVPGPHVIVVNWLVQGVTQDTVICSDTLVLRCLSDCIGLVEDTIQCNADGTYQYSFAAYNNFTLPIHEFEFIDYTPSTAFATPPVFTGTIPVSGIGLYTTTVSGNPGDVICFRLKAYERIGNKRNNCCTTDSVYCFTLPPCNQILQPSAEADRTKTGYLSVYPNPLHGVANISFSVPRSGEVEFKIFTIAGDLVSVPYSNRVDGQKTYTLEINLSALKKGTYIGLLKTDTGYSTFRKLIVQD